VHCFREKQPIKSFYIATIKLNKNFRKHKGRNVDGNNMLVDFASSNVMKTSVNACG